MSDATFGEVLKLTMKKKGVTNEQIAAALQKSESAVSHLISGRTKSVDANTSKIISRVLDTAPDFWSNLKADTKANPYKGVSSYLQALDQGVEESEFKPGILVDHQILDLIGRSKSIPEDNYDATTFILESFERTRLKAASYDTVIGGYWSDLPKRGIPKPLSPDGAISLEPRQSKFVFTKEHFRTPSDIVGRVGPTVDLISCGVSVSHGPLIAPLFEGRLTVAVHNFTDTPVSITAEQRFIKVVFEKLSRAPEANFLQRGMELPHKSKKELSEIEEKIAELETRKKQIEQLGLLSES